jgi:hypothetical protein
MKKVKMPKGGAKLAKVPRVGKIAMPKMGGARKKKGIFG